MVRHTELNQQIADKKFYRLRPISRCYMNWTQIQNSSSNELKSHMEDFILIMMMLLKSDEGFGSGKNMCWIYPNDFLTR